MRIRKTDDVIRILHSSFFILHLMNSSFPIRLFYMIIHFYSAFKHYASRSRHIDMIVAFAPFYLKRTTIHYHGHSAMTEMMQYGCHCRGASSCATGLRNAASALPYSHSDFAVSEDCGKFHVGALRKKLVKFSLMSDTCHVDMLCIIGKNDRMGIAHTDKCG